MAPTNAHCVENKSKKYRRIHVVVFEHKTLSCKYSIFITNGNKMILGVLLLVYAVCLFLKTPKQNTYLLLLFITFVLFLSIWSLSCYVTLYPTWTIVFMIMFMIMHLLYTFLTLFDQTLLIVGLCILLFFQFFYPARPKPIFEKSFAQLHAEFAPF